MLILLKLLPLPAPQFQRISYLSILHLNIKKSNRVRLLFFICKKQNSYLDFLETVFFVFLETVLELFLEADDAGFKMIDLATRKEGAFATVFLGIKTLIDEAFFLGAFKSKVF